MLSLTIQGRLLILSAIIVAYIPSTEAMESRAKKQKITHERLESLKDLAMDAFLELPFNQMIRSAQLLPDVVSHRLVSKLMPIVADKMRDPIEKMTQHDAEIVAVGLRPDGKMAFSADKKGTVRCWYTQKKPLRSRILKTPHKVHSFSFSRDGNFVAGIASSGVILWDCRNFDIKIESPIAYTFSPQKNISALTFSPNGLFMAYATYDQITIVSLVDVVASQSFNNLNIKGIARLEISADSTFIVCKGHANTIGVYNLEHSIDWVFQAPEGTILTWHVSACGTYLIVGFKDKVFIQSLRDVAERYEIPLDENNVPVRSNDTLKHIKDSIDMVISHLERRARNIASLKKQDDPTFDSYWGMSVPELLARPHLSDHFFSPRGKFLIMKEFGTPFKIYRIHRGQGEYMGQLEGHKDRTRCWSFSEDEHFMLTGGDERPLQMYGPDDVTVKLWCLSWNLEQLILLKKLSEEDPTLWGNADAIRVFNSLPKAWRLKYYCQKRDLIGQPDEILGTEQD